MAKSTNDPGYAASDILEDVQGAIWDRMEAFKGETCFRYTGVIGEAMELPAPHQLIITDAYGKRWLITVEGF